MRAPQTVAEAIRAATDALGPTSTTARLDAELLMAAALGVGRSAMLLHHLRNSVPDGFQPLIARRMAHEPVAYILGETEFYGLTLAVSPATLIPRADSETLIEAARVALAARPPKRILDCGTGTGALLLAALSLWPQAEAVGVDRSAEALAVAAGNGARLAPAARWLHRDWDRAGWADGLGRFDLVLANPPYVEDDAPLEAVVRNHEPPGALFAGAEGLDAYRVLVPQLPALLAEGGVALVEIGSRQADAVAAIAAPAGLASALHHDLAGRPRALQMWIA